MRKRTTSQRVYLVLASLLMVVSFGSIVFSQENYSFRHVDSGRIAPPEIVTSEVRLLTDEDFAPFSYKNEAGEIVGISVDMAMAACAAAHMKCQISALPFVDLFPALLRGDGEVIISGLRTTQKMMKDISLTQPYFLSSAQFVTRLGSSLSGPDFKTLAGRRVGFVKNTSHQAFLEKYYGRSALTGFSNEVEMFENLRTGGLDVAFADATHAKFWIDGKQSRACCEALGEGFIDRITFSRGLAFIVKRDQSLLRENFDYGLDQVQILGDAQKIFKRYFPKASF